MDSVKTQCGKALAAAKESAPATGFGFEFSEEKKGGEPSWPAIIWRAQRTIHLEEWLDIAPPR